MQLTRLSSLIVRIANGFRFHSWIGGVRMLIPRLIETCHDVEKPFGFGYGVLKHWVLGDTRESPCCPVFSPAMVSLSAADERRLLLQELQLQPVHIKSATVLDGFYGS